MFLAFNPSLTVILHNVCILYEIPYRFVSWTTLQRCVGINFCGFSHFNPLWAPSFWCLHAVKVIEAVGSDEVAVSPCHSGHNALFFHLGGCKHGVTSLVTYSWFSMPNKVLFAPIKGPLHSTLPRAISIAPTNFYFFWPLNGWDFLIGSPMLPSSTNITIVVNLGFSWHFFGILRQLQI